MKQYTGIIPAIVTPFRADGSLHESALSQVIERCIGQGVSGFYVGGSTGESFLLSDGERVEMIRLVHGIVRGRVEVIANIGAFSTDATCAMAREAAKIGVSAISAVPPFYFPYNLREMEQYYYDVQAAADLPMVIYNVPALSNVSLQTEKLQEMLGHPGMTGIKQTTYNLYQTGELVRANPGKSIFCGHDEIFLPALAVGVKAAIGSTFSFMADIFVEIQALYDRGEMQEAGRMQGKANQMITALLEVGIFKAIKGVLRILGMDCGECRRPFLPIDKQEYQKLETALKALY